MDTKKKCDICEHEMIRLHKKCEFYFEGMAYHAEASVFQCGNCGYIKLTTGDVKFWEDDIPIKEDTQSRAFSSSSENTGEDKNKRPSVFHLENGKIIVSDEWLDWMLRRRPGFIRLYDKWVSKERRQQRYLEQHTPQFKAIINNVLYDTDSSTMFFSNEKNTTRIMRMYNYVTSSGKYFRIITRYGYPDELTILSLKEVKQMLSMEPDIYREVVPDEVEE